MPRDIASQKALTRREALERRDALSAEQRAAASRVIAERAWPLLEAALAEGFAPPVAWFRSIRSEVDTAPLVARLEAAGIPHCLPVVTPEGLIFRSVEPGVPLEPAGFGLLQPPASAREVQPRLLIVPLAAFDATGARLGYGRGYYDGALARLSALGPIRAIGLGFSAQEVDRVPMEPHDHRLDMIVTETGTIGPFARA